MKNYRSILTGLIVVGLIAGYNLYLYSIQNFHIDKFEQKFYYNIGILLFVCPLIWLGNNNFKDKREIEFRKIAVLVISVISGMIAINNQPFFAFSIPGIVTQMYFFNGISLAIVLYGLLFTDKNGDL